MVNELRQKFRVEYLAQLPMRKGDNETRRIEIGEIVLMADEKQKEIKLAVSQSHRHISRQI